MATADLSHRFEGESVGRALELVGERWTLLILREAFFGVQRFSQLARDLNIPRPTLSSRLRMLVDVGLLDRVPYSRDPERHEYRLTDKGLDLYPILVAVREWGDRYMAEDGPPLKVRHRDCGGDPRIHLQCDRCGEEVGPREAEAKPGPGLKAA